MLRFSGLFLCACSAEAVSLFAPEWFRCFIFALLPHSLFMIDRRMAYGCCIFADFTAWTACMVETFGALGRLDGV
jgi:hypothetical protein